MTNPLKEILLPLLDQRAEAGTPAVFWWRDDDAIEPTPALDHLLALSRAHRVPVALAVIPAGAGAALAGRIGGLPEVSVAVHGWSHENHAPPDTKKAELGSERPVEAVFADLSRGMERIRTLFPARFTPALVPPWNRIASGVVEGLAPLGFRAFSVYGPERPAPVAVINTHADLIDWHGTGGCRPEVDLARDIVLAMERDRPIGILSHHLVHDEACWRFLDDLFALTSDHPGCRWAALPELVEAAAVA